MFICDNCGECCRNLDKSQIYSELDIGNGTCKYLRENRCIIYKERPLLCRVDESFELFFKEAMKIEEYYRLNYEACNILKNKKGRN